MIFLVPGGAGYIGSHMVRYLQETGHEAVVLDDFSTGHEWAVKDSEILRLSLLDQAALSRALKGRKFDCVIHFAGKSLVDESIKRSNAYYRSNVVGSLNLINELMLNDNHNVVFSSSAAIFGNPIAAKINEDHPRDPINPYGRTKLTVENFLQHICDTHGMNATCLRYFNAAGAHHSGKLGEAHEPETHLIPKILNSGNYTSEKLKVYGHDYDTPDGTCIRDYVHVEDLAQAHLKALEFMQVNEGFSAFNLGNGNGFSVLEVITACEHVLGKRVEYQFSDRREGDPPVLIADSRKAAAQLGWSPKYTSLESIIMSAYFWHLNESDFSLQ